MRRFLEATGVEIQRDEEKLRLGGQDVVDNGVNKAIVNELVRHFGRERPCRSVVAAAYCRATVARPYTVLRRARTERTPECPTNPLPTLLTRTRLALMHARSFR